MGERKMRDERGVCVIKHSEFAIGVNNRCPIRDRVTGQGYRTGLRRRDGTGHEIRDFEFVRATAVARRNNGAHPTTTGDRGAK